MINPEQIVMWIYVEIVLDQKHADSRCITAFIFLKCSQQKLGVLKFRGLNMSALISTLKVSF